VPKPLACEAGETIKPWAQARGERIDRKEERVITGDSGNSSATARGRGL